MSQGLIIRFIVDKSYDNMVTISAMGTNRYDETYGDETDGDETYGESQFVISINGDRVESTLLTLGATGWKIVQTEVCVQRQQKTSRLEVRLLNMTS